MRYYSMPTQTAKINNLTTPNVVREAKELELSNIDGGLIKQYNQFVKQFGIFLEK